MRFLLLLLAILTGATGVVDAHATAPRQVATAGLESVGGAVRRPVEQDVATGIGEAAGYAVAQPFLFRAARPPLAIALWTMRRRE